jgi:NAD(P)-dependent dehydrogenase (short-subunit alcohol dehydrogenase family)
MSESSLSEDVTPSPLPPPGTRIIVTGAAQGIGRAVADAFHARGARVCAFDLGTVPDAPSSWIVARGNVSVCSDLEAAFARMEDEWGGVDVVHANAGISANKPTIELTEEEWRRTIDVNLTGAFLTAQAGGRRMLAQGAGLLLFTASLYHAVGGAGRAAYCGSKGGVANLARALACEWAEQGVRVNALAPGYVETALVADLLARGRLDGAAIQHRSPQRRLVQPREVAAMALFLASPAASSINGALVSVDGGWTANGAP